MLGCVEPATQVLVWVDIPEASEMRERATRLHVRVYDGDDLLVHEEERRLTGDGSLTPPVSISVVPRDGDASRSFRVDVALLDDTLEFAHQSAEGSFVEHELREIRLRFDDACLAVTCSLGRTCIEGRCERACFDARPPGETTRSQPGRCPCECTCEGDTCVDGFCIPRQPVDQVFGGFLHACAIADGSLFCWGDNGSGQLGLGDRDQRAVPSRVDIGQVSTASLGESHTCAVLADQSLWCWGSNEQLQLGGPGGDELVPHRVDERSWASVGAGAAHTCAITASGGDGWCWGANEFGQAGIEWTGAGLSPPQPPSPILISGAALGGLDDVLAGAHHTCVRQGSASRLWCWGSNSNGVLGREEPFDSGLPNPVAEQVVFTDFSAVRQAAAGGWHMAAVSGEDRVYLWGDEANGRLGLDVPDGGGVRTPTFVLDGIAVDAGLRHTCVIHEDRSLSCFGQNERGALGVGSDALEIRTPQLLREHGWERLGLGSEFSCGIRRGGALYCWGNHANGRLGIGEPTEIDAEPVTRRTPARVCL
jgi:alpha-tubulin suppressor-like RCC1 family protein